MLLQDVLAITRKVGLGQGEVSQQAVVGPGSAKDTALPQLFPNPHAMDFDHKELACILLHGGMREDVIG